MELTLLQEILTIHITRTAVGQHFHWYRSGIKHYENGEVIKEFERQLQNSAKKWLIGLVLDYD